MKELATPRPWHLTNAGVTVKANDVYICDCNSAWVEVEENLANAELIVKCVNTHDQLVVALEEIMRLSSMVHLSVDAEDLLDSAYDIAKAALKSVKQ
jgi:translation initiation factor RLI1